MAKATKKAASTIHLGTVTKDNRTWIADTLKKLTAAYTERFKQLLSAEVIEQENIKAFFNEANGAGIFKKQITVNFKPDNSIDSRSLPLDFATAYKEVMNETNSEKTRMIEEIKAKADPTMADIQSVIELDKSNPFIDKFKQPEAAKAA